MSTDTPRTDGFPTALVERQIKEALNPVGMSVHSGKVTLDCSHVQRILAVSRQLERELSAQCGKWISVNDRLPQIYERVLLQATNDDYVRVGEYLGHKTFSAETGYPVLGQFHPTHWQPLPPPPKA